MKETAVRVCLLTFLFLLWQGKVVFSSFSHFPEDRNGPDCLVNGRLIEPVKATAIKAKAMLQESNVPIKNRLLIMILFSQGFSPKAKHNRLEWLLCSLLKLHKELMPTTPADVFIWALNTTEYPVAIPSWFNVTTFPRTHIIEIPPEIWKIPCGLSSNKEWPMRRVLDVHYYLMGRWRLTFAFDFAKEMGYEYQLQFDDDTILNSPVPFNIISEFQSKQYSMGVTSFQSEEPPSVILGLAELTNYWLTIRKFTPKGLIYQHLLLNSSQLLTSATWDRIIHPGYFFLVKVSFWFSPEIQDYLTTVLRSGRDIEGRWQEQAVMNMIRLIFVREKELRIINDFEILHDRHDPRNFEKWCIKSGVLSNVSYVPQRVKNAPKLNNRNNLTPMVNIPNRARRNHFPN